MNPAILNLLNIGLTALAQSDSNDAEIQAAQQLLAENEEEVNEAMQALASVELRHLVRTDDQLRARLGAIGGTD